MDDPFHRRLLAEAVRQEEKRRGQLIRDQACEALASRPGLEFEERLLVRAENLDQSRDRQVALKRLSTFLKLVLAAGVILAFILGVVTARSTLGVTADKLVNFFLVLLSLLGIQSLALLLWLLILPLKTDALANFSFGRAIWAMAARGFSRFDDGPRTQAVLAASGEVQLRSGVAKWRFGLASHALWLAFGLGALLACLFLLSARHYQFVWETTILSPASFEALTRYLAVVPGLIGFPVPDSDLVAASQWVPGVALDPGAGTAWSGLLVGSLICYGLLPRALLLGLCWSLEKRARRSFRLDESQPEYQRLRPLLYPHATSADTRAPEAESWLLSAQASPSQAPAVGRQGLTALLALELNLPPRGWPPPLPGVDWLDLGAIETRADQTKIIGFLQQMTEKPRAIVVAVDLAATPDRGTAHFIHDLQEQTGLPTLLLLLPAQRRESRLSPTEWQQRRDDWHHLAHQASVPDSRVFELDPDELDPATAPDGAAARLGLALGADRTPVTP